jgi:NADPH-dependent glutamate synthase beta subunit-like oxidoreductase
VEVCGEKGPAAAKKHRIAVLGAGLAGVTAAWDLLKKGFSVSVFDSGDHLGGSLWDLPEQLLPREVIIEELSILETMMADIRLGIQLDKALFDQVCEEYEAVILDRDSLRGIDLSLKLDDDGLIAIAPATGATDRDGVFAGGGTRFRGGFSPVMETLEGRKPALSITHDAEGQLNSADKTRALAVPGFIPALMELTRCHSHSRSRSQGLLRRRVAHGGEALHSVRMHGCVKKCLFMERYKYPKKYA